MRILKSGLLVSAFLFSHSAFAIVLTHTATQTTCPLTNSVHGNCLSTSTNPSFFDRMHKIDIDCKVRRDGLPMTVRVQTIHTTSEVTSFSTSLHTALAVNTQFCTHNKSKYHMGLITSAIVVGQEEGLKCEWIQGGGILH